MSFFTFSFFIFLIVLMIPYFLLPQRPRTIWLLVMNLIFTYLVGGWCMLGWLMGSIVFSYIGGRLIHAASKKKPVLVCFLLVELACLCVLKLQTFVVTNVNLFRGWLGLSGEITALNILVPLGVSFFMLQFTSYLVDVYMGRCEAETDFISFAAYGTFFPQIMSGPINRWTQMKDHGQEVLGLEPHSSCSRANRLGIFEEACDCGTYAVYRQRRFFQLHLVQRSQRSYWSAILHHSVICGLLRVQ